MTRKSKEYDDCWVSESSSRRVSAKATDVSSKEGCFPRSTRESQGTWSILPNPLRKKRPLDKKCDSPKGGNVAARLPYRHRHRAHWEFNHCVVFRAALFKEQWNRKDRPWVISFATEKKFSRLVRGQWPGLVWIYICLLLWNRPNRLFRDTDYLQTSC